MRTLIVVVAAFVFAGCAANRIANAEAIGELHTGMTVPEVEAIAGTKLEDSYGPNRTEFTRDGQRVLMWTVPGAFTGGYFFEFQDGRLYSWRRGN
jgi:hypothetical protein